MTTICRAFWLEGPDRPGLRVDELGALAAGSVEIASRFGAISRGTEALVAAGRVPESEHERMRAPLQDGDFPFPVKYGYSTVGEIVAGPADRLGRDGLLPASASGPVPGARRDGGSVPDGRAGGTRRARGQHGDRAQRRLGRGRSAPGDRVAIVGGGVVGAAGRRWLAARIPGTDDLTLVDLNPARAAIAQALGCRFASPADAPADCDVVVHASASAAGLATALAAAGRRGAHRRAELVWRPSGQPCRWAGHSTAAGCRSSPRQVGHASRPARRPRWSLGRRLAAALALLADPRLDALVSGETPLRRPARSAMAASCRPGDALPSHPLRLTPTTSRKDLPMFAVEVRDHVMIAHSLPRRSSGRRRACTARPSSSTRPSLPTASTTHGLVVDIGLATDALARRWQPLNYQNLDEPRISQARSPRPSSCAKHHLRRDGRTIARRRSSATAGPG